MIIIVMIVLQVVLAAVIVFILLELLKRELVKSALEDLEQIAVRPQAVEVEVISASELSAPERGRMLAALAQKFPAARVETSVNSAIKGGLVIKDGAFLLDHSLLTRIKHLFGAANG